MMEPGLYNMDCMDAMKQFPDGFFDLAVVDPPYGDGGENIGGGGDGLGHGSTDTRWNRFGQRFDRYKTANFSGGYHGKDKYHMGLSEQGEHGPKSTAKKSSRGTSRRGKSISTSSFASHASRSYGAGITSTCRRPGAFWFGKSSRFPKISAWQCANMPGQA